MRGVALNFFPLETRDFTVTLYRLPYVEGRRPTAGSEEAARRSLEVDGIRDYYWTLFQPTEAGVEMVCKPSDNNYVTIDALRIALFQSCWKNLESGDFSIVGQIHKRVEITIATHDEGSQVISLEPYLLRSRSQFGFLADFRFHPIEEHRGTQRSQQLSLSLDRHGRSNPNYYADRYAHLADFVKKYHSRIFSSPAARRGHSSRRQAVHGPPWGAACRQEIHSRLQQRITLAVHGCQAEWTI